MTKVKQVKGALFRTSVLGRFLLICLPLIIIVFVLVLTSYQITKYKNEHHQLTKSLDSFIATYSLVLSKPIAERNEAELSLYTITLLSNPDISEVKIQDADGQLLQGSDKQDLVFPSTYKKSVNITYATAQGLSTVGRLTIGVSDKRIAETLSQIVYDSIILLVFLLAAAALGIFIAYKKSVGYPLKLLINSIADYHHSRKHKSISYGSANEFGKVIEAYNEMQEHEAQLNVEIKQYQKKLEQEIQETKTLQVQLMHEATHDSLTNLYNRRTFDRKLGEALAHAKTQGTQGAIISMDLDRFKIVNDTCGHAAGDKLLQELSNSMTELLGSDIMLARLGGDEFAVFTQESTLEESTTLAESILALIKEFGFSWQGKYFEIGVSIGIVPYDAENNDIHYLMRLADIACYEAKEQGRNRIQVYRKNDAKLANKFYESEMVTTLNTSLQHNRFELWFQHLTPVADQHAGSAHTFEILVRMRDERGQLVSPGAFLPAAERFGLATRLDEWVVEQVFEFFNQHADIVDATDLCLVNLSGLSVGNDEFLVSIKQKSEKAKFPLNKLCFEVTETAAIINMPKARKFIYALQYLGYKFALDDFGSGMSSFEYLKNLPLDILKIDGNFIREITNDEKDASIVEAMIQVGKVMGKKVVAEFVENEAIYQKLKTMNVDYAQGYHLSIPRPLSELASDTSTIE